MSQAFDSLHPSLMLSRLRAYGFEENTLNLLRSHLTDRQNSVSMYVDDHQLYDIGEDLAKVKSSLSGNAEMASRWYEVNLLKGNFSKYKTMLMHNNDKVTSLTLNIQGNEIELTDKLLPLLGVPIDCDLTFSDHINSITKKAS